MESAKEESGKFKDLKSNQQIQRVRDLLARAGAVGLSISDLYKLLEHGKTFMEVEEIVKKRSTHL